MSTTRVRNRAPVFVLGAIAFTCVAFVGVFYGVGSLLEADWKRETSRTVAAAPERVGALVKDLDTWPAWSAMDLKMGSETVRTVSGERGTVGHSLTWSGARGKATLTFTEVGADFVEYTYGVVGPKGEVPGWHASGRVAWTPADNGCRIVWIDRSHWDNLVNRWFAWFGAPQERIAQIQQATLTGLEEELGKPQGQPPK